MTLRSLTLRLSRATAALLVAGGVAVAPEALAKPPAKPAAKAAKAASAPAAACPPVARDPQPSEMKALLDGARDRGLLWRISKDQRTSYLYGTLHVGRLAWLFPGPTVAAALRESSAIALELDPTDPEVVRRLDERLAKSPLELPAPLAQRLQAQRVKACVQDSPLAQAHPVMQAAVLQILSGRGDGLDPAYAQEGVLAGIARGTGKDLLSLETPEQQLDVVIPKDRADQLAMIDSALKTLESGRARPLVRELSGVWERGDLERLASYADWCDCIDGPTDREHLRQLVDGRNPGMAERIDALHAEGRTLFVAVGALHMAGPKALPQLLSERGWKVERVPLKP